MEWPTRRTTSAMPLQALGERTTDPALLEQAIAAHRAALTVRTPEATPLDWATSQNNLGNALQTLANVPPTQRFWNRPSPPTAPP